MKFLTAAGLAVLLPVLYSCSRDPGESKLRVALRTDERSSAVAALLQQDLRARDSRGRIELTEIDPDLAIRLSLLAEDGPLSNEGYSIHGADGEYGISSSGVLGLQYGFFDLLERVGLFLVHPEQTLFPETWCVSCVGEIDERHEPAYGMRGTHIHTMHPIEYESTLLGHDAETLGRFRNLLGWLIARRQNYLEWNLLRTVDFELWLAHATTLVQEAHARGFRMGIVVPFAFRQQNSFTLIDPESAAPAEEQIARSVDRLMTAGWDMINVEMGASEFVPVSDVEQVEWLDFLASYLDEHHPGTGTATKVHVSSDQFAPNYGGINFNFIPQFADTRVGVMPHTVQFYDLYRTAPTYGNEDFSAMRDFLLSQIGKRPVYYYPETAYWVTFDVDVPIFLPQYAYSRWNDLHRLNGSGMDGQINFSSGFEWGYWLNDWATAWYAFEPGEDYLVPIRRLFSIFGKASAEAIAIMDRYVRWQGEELLERNGIRWLIAWDAADDLGHFAGIHAQPVRIRLYELEEMSNESVEQFEREELAQLRSMVDELEAFAAEWRELGGGITDFGRPVYDELRVAMDITAVRARFVLSLYEAVVARRSGEPTGETEKLDQARELMDQALLLVAEQENRYRFPKEEIAADRPSLTSYPFGYLRTVSDLWYWERELAMATVPTEYNFFTSLYDLAASAGL